jgi:Zn-dependent protease with chaperone function
VAFEAIPGVNILLQNILGAASDSAFRLIYLASAVRASERQFPQVHRLVNEACHILDAPHVPEVYVAQTPFFHAGTIGIERPFIVLNAAVIDTLTEEELRCVIGHELSHCLSGYALYKTLLQVLLKLSVAAWQIPLGGAALFPVIVALMEWNRKSELSADRAALLVTQEPAVSYALLMKLAGGPQAAQMDVNEFFIQATEYDGAGNPLTRLHKLLNLILVSHPFPVIRLTELQAWVNSGTYAAILAQTFPTREAHSQPVMDQVMSQLKETSETYQDQWERSKETVTNLMTEVFSNLDTWTHQALQGVGSLMDFVPQPGTPPKPDPTAAPTSTPEQSEIFATLKNLRELQEQGIITAEEFETQKAKLLSRL